MNKETKKEAYRRMVKGKASKSELRVLISWAQNEVLEWNKFLKECKKQLTKNYEQM